MRVDFLKYKNARDLDNIAALLRVPIPALFTALAARLLEPEEPAAQCVKESIVVKESIALAAC